MSQPQPSVTVCGMRYQAVQVMIDGREIEAQGFIRDGRTYVPARDVMQQLGGSVVWVGNQRALYAQLPERQTTVRVTVGSPVVRAYRYNGSARYGAGQSTGTVRLDASPFQCDGRVYAPVRTAAEAAGAAVQFDRQTRTVSIRVPEQT